ncbi:hypothetical protein LOY37_14190 [Pseudomonas sp. B21-012]|uniref:hypothetical protein n=1 Tax=Pseudomonas sp. B21-012 TaxID=2895472 RepID=UPI002160585B|nr:hypothetical protein [Pseudomonas sp. B21-012]UVM53528.1 hypothetical protein LOY37_14190 [Pseudomonas sp. B21-012]
MSPHIAIDRALDDLEQSGSRLQETLTEALIVRHFSAGGIDADEFKHYCERVRRVAERRKEVA